MKVVVVGAAGQLGRGRPSSAGPARTRSSALTRARARPHRRRGGGGARSTRSRPTLIVNCAAYNDVDGAEDDPVDGASPSTPSRCASLAAVAARTGATLVHYSTDFVFDGAERATPYTEADAAQPAERLRRLEAARRVVRGDGAARLRAARREPVRRRLRAQQRRQAARWPRAGRAASACSPIATSRRATSPTSSRRRRGWSRPTRRPGSTTA